MTTDNKPPRPFKEASGIPPEGRSKMSQETLREATKDYLAGICDYDPQVRSFRIRTNGMDFRVPNLMIDGTLGNVLFLLASHLEDITEQERQEVEGLCYIAPFLLKEMMEQSYCEGAAIPVAFFLQQVRSRDDLFRDVDPLDLAVEIIY